MEEAAGRPARVQRRGSGKERVRDKQTQGRFGNRKSEGKRGRQNLWFDLHVGLIPHLILYSYVLSTNVVFVVIMLLAVVSKYCLHLYSVLFSTVFSVPVALRRLAPVQHMRYVVGCTNRRLMDATWLD